MISIRGSQWCSIIFYHVNGSIIHRNKRCNPRSSKSRALPRGVDRTSKEKNSFAPPPTLIQKPIGILIFCRDNLLRSSIALLMFANLNVYFLRTGKDAGFAYAGCACNNPPAPAADDISDRYRKRTRNAFDHTGA